MKFILFSLFLSLSTISANCGGGSSYNVSNKQGPAVEKQMDFPSFHGVANAINAEIKIRKGGTQSVDIDAPQSTLDKMVIEVEDGILKIGSVRNAGKMAKSFFTITIPSLDYLSVSGSGDIDAQGFTGGESLSLRVTGSGNINMDGSAKTMEARITGSGDIQTTGSAESGSVRLTGSGAYKGGDFAMQTANVRITGSGSAETKVSNEITGNITGSGSIYNVGDPKTQVKITGSGRYKTK